MTYSNRTSFCPLSTLLHRVSSFATSQSGVHLQRKQVRHLPNLCHRFVSSIGTHSLCPSLNCCRVNELSIAPRLLEGFQCATASCLVFSQGQPLRGLNVQLPAWQCCDHDIPTRPRMNPKINSSISVRHHRTPIRRSPRQARATSSIPLRARRCRRTR